ncbi:MAG TPA: hypothetical protein DD435_02680 [Cyanobacteria bacterium UBA8530]|nr:hypothetical protein [Cyanobacteria bacterium UBA8530]
MAEEASLHGIRLREDLTVVPQGDGTVAIALPDGQRCFRFSDQEYLLATLIHAHTSFAPIHSEFLQRTGKTLSSEKLDAFILQLSAFEMLSGSEKKKEKEKVSWRQLLRKMGRIEIPLLNPDQSLERLAPLAQALYTRVFAVIATSMIAIALGCAATQWQEISRFISTPVLSPSTKILLTWFAMGLIDLFHEYGHGLSCKFYGGKVPRMGVMLYFLLPMAFCDVNSSNLFPKNQRITVALSGLYGQGLLGGFALLLLCLFPLPPTGSFFLSQIVFMGLIFGWTNLIPLVKLDGYFLLCDLTGIVNLRPRALAYLKKWALSHWEGKGISPENREESLFLAYGILGSLASAGMVVAGAHMALSFFF